MGDRLGGPAPGDEAGPPGWEGWLFVNIWRWLIVCQKVRISSQTSWAISSTSRKSTWGL